MSIFNRRPTPPLVARDPVLAPAPSPTLSLTQAGAEAVAERVAAPRLTDKLLATDLPVLVKVADDEIAYLDSRIASTGANAVNARLIDGFKARRASLVRSRDWLAGKIAAETGRRGGDA